MRILMTVILAVLLFGCSIEPNDVPDTSDVTMDLECTTFVLNISDYPIFVWIHMGDLDVPMGYLSTGQHTELYGLCTEDPVYVGVISQDPNASEQMFEMTFNLGNDSYHKHVFAVVRNVTPRHVT